MTKSSKVLSGPSLSRFFRRFYQAQSQLDQETAERLARLSVQTFASVQLRRVSWSRLRTSAAKKSEKQQPIAEAQPAPTVEHHQPSQHDRSDGAKFDPYSGF